MVVVAGWRYLVSTQSRATRGRGRFRHVVQCVRQGFGGQGSGGSVRGSLCCDPAGMVLINRRVAVVQRDGMRALEGRVPRDNYTRVVLGYHVKPDLSRILSFVCPQKQTAAQISHANASPHSLSVLATSAGHGLFSPFSLSLLLSLSLSLALYLSSSYNAHFQSLTSRPWPSSHPPVPSTRRRGGTRRL